MQRQIERSDIASHGFASRFWWGGLVAALALQAWSGAAGAGEPEPGASPPATPDPPILWAQAPPPPGYYPPPGPPPPPPGYYYPPPRRQYYAPPPPPPQPYSWAYFDMGLTLGVPILFSRDIDGLGDAGAAIGGGAGLHVNLGLKVNYTLGLGLDFAYGGYDLSNGWGVGLGHADLGMVARGFRGGVGVAAMGDEFGLDAYAGHYWRIAGPWCAGFSGELMWNYLSGDAYILINFEVGLEFGNR